MASEPKSSWHEAFCGCLPWTRQRSSSDPAEPMNQITHGSSEPRPSANTVQLSSSKPTIPLTNSATDSGEPRKTDDAGRHSKSDPAVPLNQSPDSGEEPRPTEVQRSSTEPTASLTNIGAGTGEPRPVDDAGQHSPSLPIVPSTTIPDAGREPGPTETPVWGAMKLAMGGLKEVLDVFPPLKIAVGGLLECMTQLEMVDQNRREYERVASELLSLASQLRTNLSKSKPTQVPYSVENVARAIADQVRHIRQQQERSRTRQFAAAKEDEVDVIGCYRRVEGLFRQLQTDISLSIWDAVREQQMNTSLKDLSPAKDAWYNSALPASMTKRRVCTKNTRTKVLAEAQSWTRDEDTAKIYWMNGMAGTGKTTIACSLCKRLEEDKQLGASFFCSRDSPTCRDVNKIVPTIAYQLGRYSNPYRQALSDVLSNNPDAAEKDIETQFDTLIAKPLEGVRQAMPRDVVVVIDALDECSDIDGTKQVLDMLFRHAPGLPIKFFVTSRPEPAISERITGHDKASRSIMRLHEIERSLVQEDIKTYLTEALASIRLQADDIDKLAVQAGNLFIFAATAVRYILPSAGSVSHRQRLETVLGMNTNPDSGNKSYRDIDKLYSAILSGALDKEVLEAREVRTRELVLRTVVCAREPLTLSAIAELLGRPEDDDVRPAIQPFQSVLHISESTGVVSSLHASFPDFLLNKERAGLSLHCDEVKHNEHLATRCFDVMKQSLRFNICGLETSCRFDRDVPGLQERIDNVISPGLSYACHYWGDHLLGAATANTLAALLDEFLEHRLLFWMEVLNLKGWVGHAENILSQVLSWLPTDGASTELRQFTYDARNFVTTFAGNPASLSTPHIYLSVLPFTSNQSHVRTTYWPRTRGLLRVDGTGMEARGSAALATWNVGSRVMSIAQSSDGKRIVSGSDDGTMSIWDVASGTRIVGPLQTGERGGWDGDFFSVERLSYGPHVAFLLDGKHIACGSADGTIRLWDAHTGNLITDPLNGHAEPILSIASSPVEPLFASGSKDHTIRVYHAHNGTPLGEPFKGHEGYVLSVAFASDGKRLASGSSDMKIRVWDPHTGTTIVGPLDGHTGWVRAVAFCRDGLRIVSGADDKTVRVWDAQGGGMLAGPFEGHTSWALSVAFSPDGMQVVSGSWDNTIRVWDSHSGVLQAGPLEGHRGFVNSVLFSPDGTRILSGSYDGTICVWDARHGTTAAAKSSGHTEEIYSVAFSPDGTRAVSGSGDRTIRVWDTRDGRLVVGPLEGHTGDVNSVAFSPDGARIVSGSDDRTLRTWDALTGNLIRSFEGHTNLVTSVAFSPDGSRIASGSRDHTIRVWDSQTGELAVDPLEGHTNWVRSVAFSPDGRIVSGSDDSTVRMWNVLEATPIWTCDAHKDEVYCVAFSPDGTRVVSGSNDNTILVLNALDGTGLHGPFKGDTSYIGSVVFSPDGTRIVSGSGDRTVCVWDAQNGTLVTDTFKGHTLVVLSVAFSPDGRRIVSCSNDSTIRFWEAPSDGTSRASYFDGCTLRDDGWVTDSDSQLLVWLPPDLRAVFPLPPCSFTITPQGVLRPDFSDLLVGDRWHECYRDPPATTPP